MEFGLRPLRAVGSRYEPEAIGAEPTPRRECGKLKQRSEGRGQKSEVRGRKGRREDEGRGKMDEKRTNKIRTVRDLKVYRKAFDSAMEIFQITKNFPAGEKYFLKAY